MIIGSIDELRVVWSTQRNVRYRSITFAYRRFTAIVIQVQIRKMFKPCDCLSHQYDPVMPRYSVCLHWAICVDAFELRLSGFSATICTTFLNKNEEKKFRSILSMLFQVSLFTLTTITILPLGVYSTHICWVRSSRLLPQLFDCISLTYFWHRTNSNRNRRRLHTTSSMYQTNTCPVGPPDVPRNDSN